MGCMSIDATRRRDRNDGAGRTNPKNQRRGYLDRDAGRTFLALWGTPWYAVSRHTCKSMHTQSLAAVVALTLPE